MLDRVFGMQVFQKVAATGGFSGAARALGISPSMATKHIDAIEDRLGARLFFRSTRKLALTEAGHRYLEACERILAEIEEAEAGVAADVLEPRGTLRLNAPLAFGLREAMPVLAEFSSLYPALSLDVGLTDRFVDLVEEGWDLAIRIGALSDSRLVARKLAPINVVLCAAPAYLAANGTPETVDDLADHNCLGYTLPTSAAAGRWQFGADGSVPVHVHGTLMVNNGDALRVAAVAGQGIIYQPVFIVADDLRSGRLVPIRLDQPPFHFASAHAVFSGSKRMPAKVRLLVEFLADKWRVPPWEAGIDLPEGART